MNRLTLLLLVFLSLFTTAAFAQPKMQLAKMKQRLMTELKIDDVKADSVVSIVQDFYTNARATKSNSALKDAERKLALQNNRKEEMARLRSQLNSQQIQKLKQIMDEMKDERQHRKNGKDSTSAE